MLGSEFKRTLRGAQAGDEAAFVRLWRDANPVMIRYLRVVGADDAYDAACEGWVTVVRGLSGFRGDESAWRIWLLACARMRAAEGTLRRTWRALTAVPTERSVSRDEALEIDDLIDPADEAIVNRGVNETIEAIRHLPLGQGEILMLRLAGGLSVSAVADVVGTDVVAVRRSEARALERLGAERELIAWSLAAPPMPAEVADQRFVTAAFRSLPKPGTPASGAARVVAIGSMANRGSRPQLARSRTALLGIAAVSASVMSVGGLSAAAYVGALPDTLQQVMHDVIGAPAPGTTGRAGDAPSSAVGPSATGSAAAGLCRAWDVDKAKGAAREHSVAFRNLASAAGGTTKVEAYCAAVAPQPATTPKPDVTRTRPALPPKTTTPAPSRSAPVKPTRSSATKPPVTKTSTTKTSTTQSPVTKTPVKTAAPSGEASGLLTPSTTVDADTGTSSQVQEPTAATSNGKGTSAKSTRSR